LITSKTKSHGPVDIVVPMVDMGTDGADLLAARSRKAAFRRVHEWVLVGSVGKAVRKDGGTIAVASV
jgi:hypothetical protein